MTYSELRSEVEKLSNQAHDIRGGSSRIRTHYISRVVKKIETTEISDQEKLTLLETVYNMFGRGHVSRWREKDEIYTNLRQSLYNLILLRNNNATSMRKVARIASTSNLLRSGLIYESTKTFELPQVDGLIMGGSNTMTVETFEITTLGRKFMQNFYDKGIAIAQKEQARLNIIFMGK